MLVCSVVDPSFHSNSNNVCRKVSRSGKKKKLGYKKKKKKPVYKQKSHCNSFQSYKRRPSYGKRPKYKKKTKKKKFVQHHRLFNVPKKRPFGHHVHIENNSNISSKEKKQSKLGLEKNNKAFLAGHSATWLSDHSRRTRERRHQKSINGARKKQNLSLPRILKDSVRGGLRTIHIGI